MTIVLSVVYIGQIHVYWLHVCPRTCTVTNFLPDILVTIQMNLFNYGFPLQILLSQYVHAGYILLSSIHLYLDTEN